MVATINAVERYDENIGGLYVEAYDVFSFVKKCLELGERGYDISELNDYIPQQSAGIFYGYFFPKIVEDTVPAVTLNILYTEEKKDEEQKCDVATLLSLSEEETKNTPTESGQSTESANTPPLSEQKDAEVPLENTQDKQPEDSKDEVPPSGESDGGEQKEEADAIYQANEAVNVATQPKQRGRPRGR